MDFANQAAFDQPGSRLAAGGVNLRETGAVRDAAGNLLFRLQTGGMIAPQKAELSRGDPLMRFAGSGSGVERAMAGGWWTGQSSFNHILRFSQVNDMPLILAARILCGVPPEWSDMRLLIRVRLKKPLLAWRGLADSVIVPHPKGGPQVRMLQQNAASERRLPQLFIPGLDRLSIREIFSFERVDHFDAAESTRGWLYL